MSIIHDALKKSGQPVVGDTGKSPEKSSAPGKAPLSPNLERHRRASVSWGPIFVAAVLLLIAGPVLVPLFRSPGRGDARVLRAVSVGQGINAMRPQAAQFALEEAPLPAKGVFPAPVRPTANRPFVLSGIVFSSMNEWRDSYCLINGTVLKQGDKVGGAVIERIAPNRVTLDRGGEKITLAAAE